MRALLLRSRWYWDARSGVNSTSRIDCRRPFSNCYRCFRLIALFLFRQDFLQNTGEYSEESLRSIISTFCAIRLLELQEQPEFHTLLHAGGDFVVDLWEKVGRKAREDEQIGVKKFETLSAEKEQLRRELGNQTLEIKRLRRTCATLRERTQENEMLRVECDTLRERVLRVCRCRATDTHWDW